MTLHGSVWSKELSDLASDLGVASTYKDSKYLKDFWVLDDLIKNQVCPPELAECKPGKASMDNDDWQIEDITGEQQSVNRTNMMFIQAEKWIYDESNDNKEKLHVLRKNVKDKLNEITATEISIKSYSTKEHGEPKPYSTRL